jgi:hypothetical protein
MVIEIEYFKYDHAKKKIYIFLFPETSAITWRENMVITSLRIRGRQRPRFQEATHRARRLAIEGFET